MIKIKNINKAKDLCHLPNHLYFLNMVNYSGDILPEQFQFDDQLTFITLSSDTKVIGEKAFASCTQLQRVDSSAKIISEKAFSFCKNLKGFNFVPVAKLEEGSFEYSGLKEVSFSDTLQVVPKDCFSGCLELKSLNLNNVEEIEEEAFSCTVIPVLDLPRSLKIIGKKAFNTSFFMTDLICERADPPKICSTSFIGCPLKNIWVFSEEQANLYKNSIYWKKYVNIIKVTTTKDLQNYLKEKAKENAFDKMAFI